MNGSMIVPVTQFRRKFGVITENLPHLKEIILIKGGSPFGILTPSRELKRKLMRSTAGKLKNTEFANPKFVREFLKKKSRKTPIII